MTDLLLYVVLLGVALVALAVSTVLGLIQLHGHLRQRSGLRRAQTEALAIDGLRTELMVMEWEHELAERSPSYRHNVHCPKCGRFSRRIFEDEVVVFCSVHEMVVDWKAMPVDWANTLVPVEDGSWASITIEPAPVTGPILLAPVTEPVAVIPELDPKLLEERIESGAVL